MANAICRNANRQNFSVRVWRSTLSYRELGKRKKVDSYQDKTHGGLLATPNPWRGPLLGVDAWLIPTSPRPEVLMVYKNSTGIIRPVRSLKYRDVCPVHLARRPRQWHGSDSCTQGR